MLCNSYSSALQKVARLWTKLRCRVATEVFLFKNNNNKKTEGPRRHISLQEWSGGCVRHVGLQTYPAFVTDCAMFEEFAIVCPTRSTLLKLAWVNGSEKIAQRFVKKKKETPSPRNEFGRH